MEWFDVPLHQWLFTVGVVIFIDLSICAAEELHYYLLQKRTSSEHKKERDTR